MTGTGRAGAGGRLALLLAAAAAASAASGPLAAGAADSGPAFAVTTNSFAFDHAPAWAPDNRTVVFHHDNNGHGMQIFAAQLDGSGMRCITCGAGAPIPPNMVPTVRPQGDKVLFHSWNGHYFHFGGPGFGGIGSDFWVVNPDGTHPVELTPPELATEGMDNFHAYFSPDGRHIAWTHIDWNFVTPVTVGQPGQGTGKWSIYVGDYVDDKSGPHLSNVRQVRPENGHFYETDWWSPDGRGFLYTESSDSAMDLDLYFMDLKSGHITRLTNNHTWTEQAIFSPDGKRVIYMSIKDHEGDWAAWSKPAGAAELSPANDFLLITPLFFGLFLTPGMPPACDLYEIDLASGNQRRLTHDGDDGWIIPELAWDFAGTRLMWTELKVRDGLRGDSDPSRQPSDEVDLLQNPPPTPDRGVLDSGNELPYVTWRTRIARYVYGAVGAANVSSGTATAPGTVPLPETAAGTLPNTSLAASPDGRLFVPALAALGAVIATVLSVVRRRRRHQR